MGLCKTCFLEYNNVINFQILQENWQLNFTYCINVANKGKNILKLDLEILGFKKLIGTLGLLTAGAGDVSKATGMFNKFKGWACWDKVAQEWLVQNL